MLYIRKMVNVHHLEFRILNLEFLVSICRSIMRLSLVRGIMAGSAGKNKGKTTIKPRNGEVSERKCLFLRQRWA
jgi:hypothetical protein